MVERHAQEIAAIQEKNTRDFEELSERLRSFRQKALTDLESRDRLILQLQQSLGAPESGIALGKSGHKMRLFLTF